MAVVRPRNRVVYFRITQDEFHQLDTLCKTTDAGRSVSELSREAVRQLIVNGPAASATTESAALQRVDREIVVLNKKVDQILEFLRLQSACGNGLPAGLQVKGENNCDAAE